MPDTDHDPLGPVAVVGLGNMGMALGLRIAGRGHRVHGVDVDAGRRALWTDATGTEAVRDVADLRPYGIRRLVLAVRLAEQAADVLTRLADHPDGGDLVCYVVTTLSADVARGLPGHARPALRVVELPVSGGETAAAEGRLAVLAAGGLTEDDRAFLGGTIAGRIVTFERYGDPTLAKLLNNVTGAYNALAFARMLEVARDAGLDPRRLHEVLLAGSGGSWMAGAFEQLRDDLLDKDVALLRAEVGELPALALDEHTDLPAVLSRARDLLH